MSIGTLPAEILLRPIRLRTHSATGRCPREIISGPRPLRSSLLQAMRLSTAVGASAQVLDRDLSVLYLASGDPDQVIALLDPKVSRDDFVTNIRWGAPGQAFQLAEAYRAKGDMPAARRFHLRAQQAAVGVR